MDVNIIFYIAITACEYVFKNAHFVTINVTNFNNFISCKVRDNDGQGLLYQGERKGLLVFERKILHKMRKCKEIPACLCTCLGLKKLNERL